MIVSFFLIHCHTKALNKIARNKIASYIKNNISQFFTQQQQHQGILYALP